MGLFKKKTDEEKKATADKKAAAIKQKAEEKAVAEGMKAELENKNNGEDFPPMPPEYNPKEETQEESDKAIPLESGIFSINEDVEKSIDSAKTVYTASSNMVQDFGGKIAACENENRLIATQQDRIKEKTKELEGVFHQLDMMAQINSSYITLYKSQKAKIAAIPGIVKNK